MDRRGSLAEHHSGLPPSPGGAPLVIAQREKAAEDSDTATLQTVRKMAEYIRESANDPAVQACAEYAWRKFGMSLPSTAMKCWSVFWWVKHSVKFRLDEATMWRVGLRNEQDLLISPSVLVRMRDPAEDCDGFTMLEAAMLRCLDVPVVIVTVAASPSRPLEWSHVFPCASVDGRILPLDASHGSRPGWMVPAEHTFRWQAWTLDGELSDVRPSPGLHGYRRVAMRPRGLGAQVCPDYPDTSTCYDDGTGAGDATATVTFPYVVPGYTPPAAAPASTPASSVFTPAFWQGLINSGVNIVKSVTTPPSYVQTVRDPVTGQLVSTTIRNTATPSTAISAGAGGLSQGVVIGGGLLVGALVLGSIFKGRR